jgi:signal transduction histidine kinase/ActR/RegA family two-component response regulator
MSWHLLLVLRPSETTGLYEAAARRQIKLTIVRTLEEARSALESAPEILAILTSVGDPAPVAELARLVACDRPVVTFSEHASETVAAAALEAGAIDHRVASRGGELYLLDSVVRVATQARREREETASRQARLARHQALLQALARHQAAARAEDLRHLLAAITEAASQSMDVARASVWTYNADKTGIQALDLWDAGQAAHSAGVVLSSRDYPEYFAALQTERTIVAHDACHDPATRCFTESYLRPLGITSMLDAPVRLGGAVVGVLCHEHVGPMRQFTQDDVGVAGSMADFVSLALESIARLALEKTLRESQGQLLGAQKSEALGRLAGGVAHDFNNLLTVILGYASSLHHRLPAGSHLSNDVAGIVKAGQEAAEITRQLLAMSRRQLLEPRIVNLNVIVLEIEGVLRRLVGTEVVVTLELHEGIACVKADKGQMEQVIVNLVVNAGEAMPDGGCLTIATRNEVVEGLPEVVLSVADTGLGIDPALQPRIFEPFFTTQEHAKGTGLRLSTVQGIVAQSGGEVRIKSRLGEGSVFEVRLPAHAALPMAEEPAPKRPHLVSGTETVLLCEDEPSVREMVHKGLTDLGYRVLVAKDVDEAITHCATHRGPIDILIADVVMPKASGPVVAERVRELRPGTAVLYVSGYPAAALSHHGEVLGALLAKPFTVDALAGKLREELQSQRARPPVRIGPAQGS